jgi:Ca2+-binding EF-hand superfamily protein
MRPFDPIAREKGIAMKKILFAAAAVALGTTAAGAQLAAPAGTSAQGGIQTRNAAVERVRTMFARVDADRDGSITQEEAASLRGQARGARQARAADPARRARAFERLDANRDNMISREEWARGEALRAERRAGRPEGRGQRMAMRGRMGGAMLRAADLNRDSRVTLQEAEQAALQRFDRVDANRDGQITPAERQQARQQWQQRRGQNRG